MTKTAAVISQLSTFSVRGRWRMVESQRKYIWLSGLLNQSIVWNLDNVRNRTLLRIASTCVVIHGSVRFFRSCSQASSGEKMSPTRRKKVKAKAKVSRQEKTLVRAGLVKSARLKDEHRKKLAKLTLAEAKTLVRIKRKLGYKGTMHIQSIFF